MTTGKKNLVIGTRGSRLALWQAAHIAGLLESRFPGLTVETRKMMTTGDKILDVPLARIGGKGLFTKELEQAMLDGEINIAIHSLKDMPTELPPGLVLAAVTERADAGDALVSPRYRTFDNLPQGARLGTSSLRRRAQLLARRPDLCVSDLRGNLDTRLRKLDEGQFDAIVLAVAGLKRLGWGERITEELPYDICIPAVGQGALAVEAREGDTDVLELLQAVHHPDTYAAATLERAFLRTVEGGCQTPVGIHAVVTGAHLTAAAVILSLDGQRRVAGEISGRSGEAAALGTMLAERLLADGGQEILNEIYHAAQDCGSGEQAGR